MILIRSYGKNIIKTYRGIDCVKKFSEDLRTLSVMEINYEKKRNDTTNILLTSTSWKTETLSYMQEKISYRRKRKK